LIDSFIHSFKLKHL